MLHPTTRAMKTDGVIDGGYYRRHKPEQTLLYQIVEQHLPAFKRHLSEAGISLPAFVHREFDNYLHCGLLEHGFLRVKCNGCRFEHLVAFSCKGRGLCPSCGARRMVESAAHLIDNVLPAVPVRQWVLSFPWPLRLLFARRPDVLSDCIAIINRAIETQLIHRAGLTRTRGARSGIVTLVQRFGSALNLNIHLHILALEGAYSFDEPGNPRFHQVTAPTPRELATLLDRIIQRLVAKLQRDGLLVADPSQQQRWLDDSDTTAMDGINASSLRYRIAIGPHSGNRTMTLRNPALARADSPSKPFTSSRDGFSLNAAVVCLPQQRQRLERLCRYVTRGAGCLDRLSINGNHQIQYELKHPFADGTTAVLFSPLDFLAKLAALVPPPRHHLVRYHGVLAPNHKYRAAIVPGTAGARKQQRHHGAQKPTTATRASGLTWAERLRRVFNIDISTCPHCGGKLRIIADVTNPDVIEKILKHIAARAPPTFSTLPASDLPF